MIKENSIKVRYEHRLTEDFNTLKEGITLHCLENSDKLPDYSAWNGIEFITIPPEKVRVYQVTTKHIVEETPVDISMETHFDAYMKFPATSEYDLGTFDRLRKLLGSVEAIECSFGIEFSCGDGKYMSLLHTEEEVEKYDGKVCLLTPPRLHAIKMSMLPEQMKADKDHNFTVKYKPKTEEQIFYINGKERNRLSIRK